MAVTVEASSLVQASALCPCPASLTLAGFSPTGADRFAVISVSIQPRCITVTTVSRAGDTPTFIARNNCAVACTNVELWRIINPVTGAVNVVINFSCSPAGVAAAVINYNGVCPTTPNDTPLTNSSCNATSSSITPTTTANEYVHDLIGVGCPSCPPAITTGANQTRRLNFTDCCGVVHANSDQDGVDGGVMSWTWNCAAGMNHIAMNINDAVVGGVPEHKPLIVNEGAMI